MKHKIRLRGFACAALLILSVRAESFASRTNPVPPTSQACAEHERWIQQIEPLLSEDPRSTCSTARRSLHTTLKDGLAVCRLRNGIKDPNCDGNPPSASLSRSLGQVQQPLQIASIAERYDALRTQIPGERAGCIPENKKLEAAIERELFSELTGEPLQAESSSESGSGGGDPAADSGTETASSDSSVVKSVKDHFKKPKSDAPFQWIPKEIKFLTSTGLTAFLWRYRGGFGPAAGTQSRRLITTAGLVGIGYFNGGTDGAIAAGLLLPTMFAPYSKYWDLTEGGKNFNTNFAYMTARGLYQTSLSGAYLYARGYGPGMFFSGAAMGPCYYYGWNQGKNVRIYPEYGFVGGAPTQIAELCNGAAIGAGLSGSLLWGQ